MATDCISREAAWNGIYNCPTKTDADGYIWVRTKDVAHMIDDIPAADVRPVVRGKWEKLGKYDSGFVGMTEDGDQIRLPTSKCSNCKKPVALVMWRNFCPNCGADMRRKPGSDDEKTVDADSSDSVGMAGEEQ